MAVLLVQGWTERIKDNLLADGVAVNLTGYTVQLIAWNSSGPVTLAGTSGIDTPLSGTVYFDPASGDLVKGTLKIRWKVTDPQGKVSFFPNSVQPEIWTISNQ